MAEATYDPVSLGRIATVRLAPNEDLVEGLEQASATLGFERAYVRGGLGSLIDATLAFANASPRRIPGPAVELLSLWGQIVLASGTQPRATALSGLLAGPDGAVVGGPLARGGNPVCITLEVVIEEMLESGDRRPA